MKYLICLMTLLGASMGWSFYLVTQDSTGDIVAITNFDVSKTGFTSNLLSTTTVSEFLSRFQYNDKPFKNLRFNGKNMIYDVDIIVSSTTEMK